MTSKEKAIELTNKFYKYAHDASNGSCYDTKIWTKNAKQCSLITVNEILNILDYPSEQYSFYLETQKEIEKL
jgi:hypothetical protein